MPRQGSLLSRNACSMTSAMASGRLRSKPLGKGGIVDADGGRGHGEALWDRRDAAC